MKDIYIYCFQAHDQTQLKSGCLKPGTAYIEWFEIIVGVSVAYKRKRRQ
jgi:hypothetical protein